jgi:hypothetical protein
MTPVRFVVLAALLAACQTVAPTALDDGVGGGGSGSGSGAGGGNGATECAIDADCALAAAKCCDCPTYAVPTYDPAHRACETISCPTNTCPANARAVCTEGACMLACAPLTCAEACPQGYAIDPTGCLECRCADLAPQPQCTVDADCVRTRADCCGCTRGGTDTAVPALDQAALDAALGCPADPACPGGDTCAAGTEPRCIEGACELAMPTPTAACTGTCPTGQQCVINADATATAQGLGVCM